MYPAFLRQNSLLPLLLIGTAALCVLSLGSLPLLDVDEPVYAQVGREMVRGGATAWLSPHYNGALWFDKPPLFYWLCALSLRIFGETEFAARLPSAAMGVLTVWATVCLCRRLFPQTPHAALWAGFVLATTAQFFLLARAAVTDMTLTACLILSLLCLWAWLQTDAPKWAMGCGACVGLACLCKGPVALVLTGGLALLYLLLTGQGKRLARPGLWAALLTCLVVALPWYMSMMHLHGDQFVQGFLEANNVTRFLKPEHTETQNPLFYALWLPVLLLPWTPALIASARPAWRDVRNETGPLRPTLFCLLWIVIVFGFFSVSQTKLITYTFPLFPCAAFLAGRWLAEPKTSRSRLTAGVTVGLLGMLFVGLIGAGWKFGVSPVTLIVWAVALGAGMVILLQTRTSRRWLAPGVAVAASLLAAWMSPTWRGRASDLSERDMARAADAMLPPGAPLYVLGLKHPSLVFYSGRRVVSTDEWDAALADMTAHPEHVYAVRTSDWNKNTASRGFRAFHTVYASRHTSLVAGTAQAASAG